MYFISRGRLKPANKQYTTIKNDYELSFTDDTEVEEVSREEEGGGSMRGITIYTIEGV